MTVTAKEAVFIGQSDDDDHANPIQHDKLNVHGYVWDKRKQYLCYLYTVLSLGVLQLLLYWRPDWKLRLTHKACHCYTASTVLITDCYGLIHVEQVKKHVLDDAGVYHVITDALPEDDLRYFIHKKLKYIWDGKADEFVLLSGYCEGMSCSEVHASATGCSKEQQDMRRLWFGENIIKVNVRPIVWLILHEALNPFYVFQIYTIIVWFIQNYVLYSVAVMLLATVSIGVTVYETRKQSKKLRNSVKSSSDVKVFRGNDEWETVSSACLVPGDLMEVDSHSTMECDAVLLDGSVVVNESMLTGESVPVTKMALPNTSDAQYSADTQKRHTLYCGTEVLMTHGEEQTRIRALVIRTGFATAKGELVRSILFPKPVDMKFYSDSMKFLWVSFVLGLLAMVYTILFYVLNKSSLHDIIISALDIITFVIPPSLPATITIGNIYAQRRLKAQGIFCLSSKFINLTGTLNMVCFDKTGTLTHDGLDLEGVLRVERHHDDLQYIKPEPQTNGRTKPRQQYPPSVHQPPTLNNSDTPNNDNDDDGKQSRLLRSNIQTVQQYSTNNNNNNTPNHNNDDEDDDDDENDSQLVLSDIETVNGNNTDDALLKAMVTCHSLIRLNDEDIGDPLDLVMFRSTSWTLLNATDFSNDDRSSQARLPISRLVHCPSGDVLNIAHQFPFVSDLQRMSVIVEELKDGHDVQLFMKGAPETVVKYCHQHTIPSNLDEVLDEYTSKGYRVIALAQKSLDSLELAVPLQDIQRQDVECELSLLGLVVLQNRLKPQSLPAIRCLHAARIRSVMVTGDNLRTAVHTASCCGIIHPDCQEVTIVSALPNKTFTDVDVEYQTLPLREETGTCAKGKKEFEETSCLLFSPTECFAMEGSTYVYLRALRPELLNRLVQRGVVFARMLPELKVRLVQHYQELGYLVGMCGDGANDCGALKTANTGISLSTAEASVASPFTSTTPDIQCVPTLIKEGRCALVSSFGLFKFLLACSWIFCIAVLILYKISCDMTDTQYLYLDMVLIVLPSLFIANIAAYPTLVKFPPPPTLTRLSTMTSLIGYIVSQTIFLAGLWELTRHQPWFVPWVRQSGSFHSYENTLMFVAMSVSFAFASIIFCQGPPYRQRFYTNKIYTVMIVTINVISLLILIYPPDFLVYLFGLKRMPIKFSLLLLLLSITNLLISVLFEDFVVNIYIHRHFLPWLREKLHHKHPFEILEEEIKQDPTWPPFYSTNQRPPHTDLITGGTVFSGPVTNDTALNALPKSSTELDCNAGINHSTVKDDSTQLNSTALDNSSLDPNADVFAESSTTNEVVRLRPKRTSRTSTAHRHSALLESNFATLSTTPRGEFSRSLPDIDIEIESLKCKQSKRRSYIVEEKCFL